MTNQPIDKGATALVFKAPPPLPETEGDYPADYPPETGPRRPRDGEPPRSGRSNSANGSSRANGSLRMLKGARAAAAGMKISDDMIRAVLDDPQDVQPDPSQPTRTRRQRDGVTVTTGTDGMILRVTRQR